VEYDLLTQQPSQKIVHQTSIEISGKVTIYNNSGLVLKNSIPGTSMQNTLINCEKDISLIQYYPSLNNTIDIILSKVFELLKLMMI
jgi:hypothetical protein